ncbi:MAG: cysteine desulfurase [Butyrivibrio sp.]|nr:cysteine desulfurase [Butyrivibrio sp.]
MYPEVVDVMRSYFVDDFYNPSALYRQASRIRRQLKWARMAIANQISAQPEEIYFTSGGSESDNWALKGVVSAEGENTEILTSQIEHHAILNTCAYLERKGYAVTRVPVSRTGIVDRRAYELALKNVNSPLLVSIMMVNNEIGAIQPIKELALQAKNADAYFHTDAVQAMGHIPIDVNELHVDMLSASAHKFHGPKGIGFLYIRNGVKVDPLIHGGNQEFGMRAGTENISGIVGMVKALEISCQNMQQDRKHIAEVRNVFLHAMQETGLDYQINEAESNVEGTISLSIKGVNGEMLVNRLDLLGIAVATGSACNSSSMELSSVIKALGIPMEYAMGTIRISFGRDNTAEEAIIVAEEIAKICE